MFIFLLGHDAASVFLSLSQKVASQHSYSTDYPHSQLIPSLVLIFSARFRYKPVDAAFTVMNDIPLKPLGGVQYLIRFGSLTHLCIWAIRMSVPQPNLN